MFEDLLAEASVAQDEKATEAVADQEDSPVETVAAEVHSEEPGEMAAETEDES